MATYVRIQYYLDGSTISLKISTHRISHAISITYFRSYSVYAVPVDYPFDEGRRVIQRHNQQQTVFLDHSSIVRDIEESVNSSLVLYEDIEANRTNLRDNSRGHSPLSSIQRLNSYSGFQNIRSTSRGHYSSSRNCHPNARNHQHSSNPISLRGTHSFSDVSYTDYVSSRFSQNTDAIQ